MGVSKFFGQFLRNVGWSGIFQKSFPGQVDICAFDLNSLIHEAAQIAYAYGAGKNPMRFAYVLTATADQLEQDFFATVGQILSNAITTINPAKTVILAVDGVAPMAKIVQQRSRRFMSAQRTYADIPSSIVHNYEDFLKYFQTRYIGEWRGFLIKLDNEEVKEDLQYMDFMQLVEKYNDPNYNYWMMYLQSINYFPINRNTPDLPALFDTNAITPGTDLMHRLDLFLKEWITIYTQQAAVSTILYSSYKEPGEGEHKILDYIRSNLFDPNDIFVMYGLDADLFMLSLMAPQDNIFLVRGHSVHNGQIKQDMSDIINIDNARLAIINDLPTETAIQDFVLLTFFIGNDFLHRMPALEDIYPRKQGNVVPSVGLNALVQIYKQLGKSLTNGDQIIWENLALFLQYVAHFEPALMEYEARRKVKHTSRVANASLIIKEVRSARGLDREITFDFQTFRKLWYSNALNPKGPVVKGLVPDNLQVDQQMITNMAGVYLQGMAWVYAYYNKGLSGINSYWYYPHYESPLFTELAIVSQMMTNISGYLSVPGQTTMNVVQQLLSVLPPQSQYMLPAEVKPLITVGSILGQYFPDNYIVTQDGKDTDYEKTPLLPFINPYLLIKTIEQFVVFSNERQLYFASEGTVVMVRDDSMRDDRNYIEEKRAKIRYNSKQAKERSLEKRSKDKRNKDRVNRKDRRNTDRRN